MQPYFLIISSRFSWILLLPRTKMDYSYPSWYGFLAEQFVRNCVQLSRQNCPGCKAHLISHLLHLHHQESLLDVMRKYCEEVRGLMLSSVSKFYDSVETKLPHSDDKKKDKMIYLLNARTFLMTCNAETIYWGRYVTHEEDAYINAAIS